MRAFVGKITVGDWELAPTVEGEFVEFCAKKGIWQGNLMVSEAIARAMSRPSSLYLLQTRSGLRLKIATNEWRPVGKQALVEFTAENYPPIRKYTPD